MKGDVKGDKDMLGNWIEAYIPFFSRSDPKKDTFHGTVVELVIRVHIDICGATKNTKGKVCFRVVCGKSTFEPLERGVKIYDSIGHSVNEIGGI